PISTWIYALVAPFPTVTDGINAMELQAFWQEASSIVNFDRLILGKSSYKAIESLWGKPAGTVEVHADTDLLNLAWNTPGTWAIIPFEEIQPRWKVIALDEQSPLHKDFMPENYPLTVPISLVAIEGKSTDAIADALKPNLAQTNRDADKLATVILTGVTALVRGTAREMEKLGITRPAEVIGPALRDADILHISNEVPFAVNCGEPAPQNIDKLIFCSKDEYVELLKAVGTDVVELTGDHFEDWGPEAMLHTLELYKELGWLYYGGGRNLEEAKQPLKLEVNGNKIAFLGCNAKEWIYSNATETKPGNFHCDWDYMAAEVKQLRAEGYLPIVTFQHNEYYVWEAQSQMVGDFHRMEAAGAVIVSGSQAHQPHAIEITDNAVLHYGLGNLFFDQYGLTQDTDDAFIDRHVFYDGKYLGVELLTITFRDFSQPLWMDATARAAMLEKLFSVSKWNMPMQ
ncbi:MAG TPA: CapA family protein, partial [Anaerolineaceae bacterium]|nr:CapA family protein [Anaerolineaceae bacterium]